MVVGIGAADRAPGHIVGNGHLVAALVEIGQQAFAGDGRAVYAVNLKRNGHREAPAAAALLFYYALGTKRSHPADAAYHRVVKIMTVLPVRPAGKGAVADAGHLDVVIVGLGQVGNHKEFHAGIRPGLAAVVILEGAAHTALHHLELQEDFVSVMGDLETYPRLVREFGPIDTIQLVGRNAAALEIL